MAKTRSKYTDDFVPIKTINNGIIVLANNENLTGVKITPRNIFILEQGAQAAVLTSLKNVYNMIDYEFWLIVADRPVDISVYLSHLQLAYQNQTNPAIRKIINEDIQKGNQFMNNNVVDTEYFILFKERNVEMAQKKIRMLISALSTCGLTSRQTSNDDLRTILDNFLNGGVRTEFGMVSS